MHSSSYIRHFLIVFFLFFFNDTATTEIYTLSLHDALPISFRSLWLTIGPPSSAQRNVRCSSSKYVCNSGRREDRKSTRLNSSHRTISYAVFCLKKKKKKNTAYYKQTKTQTNRTKITSHSHT